MELFDALRVFIAAMTPIGELRLAIPYGVLALDLSWREVAALAIVGNMIPVLVLLPLLDRISALLQLRPNPIGRVLDWRVARLQASHSERYLKYGAPILVLFVAIPLPLTGAWTGTLAAWIFRVPYRMAVPLIFLGVVIAAVIVTSVTVGGSALGEWLLAYQD